jgi:tetratricopeptide (TPR) repeat protein
VYGSIGESDLSAENTRRAYELRDRTSDAERYFITASWDARVTGNALKAQKTCEAWARAYPREVIPHAYLAGFLYPSTANYEKAVEEAKTALDLRQDMAILYVIDAYDEMALGRQHAAEDILRQAGQQKLETPESAVLRYDLAFLTDGQPEREISAADATFGGDWLVYHQAAALAYAGRLRQGLSLSLRAEQMAKQAGHPETAAIYRTGSALWQALDGDLPGARRDAMAALQLSRDREVLYGAGLALAFSGQGMQSRLIAREVLQRFPEDTAVQFSYVPVMKAALALSQGAPATALEALEMTRPYELATQRSTIHGDFGALYPVYLRGQAYLLAHRGAEAVVEFRKICDHRGIVLTDPVGAMAWLQLGRAHAMTGDRIAARADYETFFKQWSSADAAVPVNRQARHEFTAMGTAVR